MFKNEQCLRKYKNQTKLVLAYEGECVDFGKFDLTLLYESEKSQKTVVSHVPVTTNPCAAGTDNPRLLMQTSANSSVRCAWAKS